MGQEFAAYADAFDHDLQLLKAVLAYAKELPIGGTAVGTGVSADPAFGAAVIRGINSVDASWASPRRGAGSAP